MQSTLALYNLLHYAARVRKRVYLYVQPLGLRSVSPQHRAGDDGLYTVTGYRLDEQSRCPAQIPIRGWLDPFWRVLEQAGWQVGERRRVAQGELLWSLVPRLEPHKTEGVPQRDELVCYVERIQPMAGDRAERALEIAISGKVHKRIPGEDGKDRWEVESSHNGHYTVSIEGGFCTCPDAANGAPTWMGSPLCKHRLAVMYIYRWEQDQKKRYTSFYPPEQAKPTGEGTPLPPYVTIAPPAHSKQGWRCVRVRKEGQLNLSSRDEFKSPEEAMLVAFTIANCEGIPLYLNGFNKKEGW